MSSHPEINEAIAQALEGVDPGKGQRTAFDLARALRGVIARFGLKSEYRAVAAVVQLYAEDHGLDPEDLEAAVYLVWDSIVSPEGVDPVTAAAQTARAGSIPEGFMPHAPERPRRLCWLTLEVARQLSGHGERVFYVSARKLAAALGTDPMSACRILNLLCNSGHLEKVGKPAPGRAQKYRFKSVT